MKVPGIVGPGPGIVVVVVVPFPMIFTTAFVRGLPGSLQETDTSTSLTFLAINFPGNGLAVMSDEAIVLPSCLAINSPDLHPFTVQLQSESLLQLIGQSMKLV